MAIPAIEAAMLRDLMRKVTADMPGAPAQPIRAGEVLGGRITMSPDGARMLMIDGVRIPAQLPADLPAGVALKLQVTEATPDRLVLQVLKEPGAAGGISQITAAGQSGASDPAQAAAQNAITAQTPWGAIPMPGGAQARMWLDPDLGPEATERAATDRARSMVVRYDSQTLGRMDVVLRLDADKLEATVLGQAGEPIARMRASVGELRTALMGAAERPVSVSTGGRATEVIDVSA